MGGGAIAAAMGAGLLVGSFVGVLVARVPSNEPVVAGRSRCDGCGAPLRPLELIPVVSWVVLRGRCSTCRASITPLWTILELLTGAAFVVALRIARDVAALAVIAPFLAVLIALTVIDLRTFRLPDAIVLPATAVAAIAIAVADLAGGSPSLLGGAVGAVAFGGALGLLYLSARRLYGAEAMGFGDVKLAVLLGLVLGAVDLRSVPVAGGMAVLLGGLVGVVALALGAGRRAEVPFGPMLCTGAFVALVWGSRIADAYLRLFR